MGVIGNIIANVTGKGAADIIESAGNVADKFITTDAEREQFKAELAKEVNRHAEAMKDSQVRELELTLGDTANAREMNAKIQGDKPSWLARNVAYIIDCFVFSIWGAMTIYVICMMLNFIKSDADADVSGVLGVYSGITAIAMTVLNFHRGTSRGSEKKTDAMVENMKK